MEQDVRRMSFATHVQDVWLPASPASVWPWISDPARLNRWSAALVHGIEAGDGGRFDTVGTLRRVVLPRPLPVVSEVVQYADAPHRFVYRAIGSRAIRYHHGQMRLFPADGGTQLCWNVAMSLPLVGAAALVHRILRPELDASLRRLASVVKEAPEAEPPQAGLRDDHDDAAATAARGTVDELRSLADDMVARGDARHWFSRVYQYVTEEMIDACHRREVAHPTWVLRLVPRFHQLYSRNLTGPPEPHWQEAFDAISHAVRTTGSGALPFWGALVAGARAHIEGDLPRVLASTYLAGYQGRCHYARFRADFMLLAAPLQRAWQRLSGEVPPRWFPPYLRALDRILPPEAVEALTAERFYDPLIARRHAFEQGRALAAAAAEQSPDSLRT